MGMFVHGDEDDNKPSYYAQVSYQNNDKEFLRLEKENRILQKKLSDAESKINFVIGFCELMLGEDDDYLMKKGKQKYLAKLILNRLDGTNEKLNKE